MKKSGIEWCDYTWNPITGCRHNCEYCYARKMVGRFSGNTAVNKLARADYQSVQAADKAGDFTLYVLDKPMVNENGKSIVYPFGFEPTFHRYRLDWLNKLGSGQNIFVGAMSDMFGWWVPSEWIQDVIQQCESYPQHNYLFLTKNPERYMKEGKYLPVAGNFWYGTTVTTAKDLNDREWRLPRAFNCMTFLSIEPLLEDLEQDIPFIFDASWVIIGAETGNRRDKVVPKKEWVDKIVEYCDQKGIPVFMKDSLLPVMGEENMFREYPPALLEKRPNQNTRLFGRCGICGETCEKSEMYMISEKIEKQRTPASWMCKGCFQKYIHY